MALAFFEVDGHARLNLFGVSERFSVSLAIQDVKKKTIIGRCGRALSVLNY